MATSTATNPIGHLPDNSKPSNVASVTVTSLGSRDSISEDETPKSSLLSSTSTTPTAASIAGTTPAVATNGKPSSGSSSEINIGSLFQWGRSRWSARQGHGFGSSSKSSVPRSASSSTGLGGGAGVLNSSTTSPGVVIGGTSGNGTFSAANTTTSSRILETSGGNGSGGVAGRPPRHPHNLAANPRRIAKIRHRSSTNSSSSVNHASAASPAGPGAASSAASSANSTNITAASSTTATPATHPPPHLEASSSAGSESHNSSSGTPTVLPEMDSPVLSFWGPDLVPLPTRFARIKRNLIAGHEAALEAAWARLIPALRAEAEHIEGLGSHLIPSIEFADVDDQAQTARFGRDLKRYGVGVIRGVVPRADAERMVQETMQYLEKNHDSKPPPLPQDPTCFDFFWTPAQVRTRAHPSVLKAQRYMMGLWGTNGDQVATKYPIAYADRIRIHTQRLGTGTPAESAREGEVQPNGISMAPRSVDNWLSVLRASGVIAQIDNGSLERWEPDGYGRVGTYSKIFGGAWEEYDPWEVAGRAGASTDLYNGYASCSIFRMFQGLIALTAIEPGMIRLVPSPKLAVAYFLLRPFFSPKSPPPQTREGPEWDAYLAPENWTLDKEQTSFIHGAVPGHAQRVTELWHPHLSLRRTLITLPTLQSGDYIFWHPDLMYHITSNGAGLRSPIYSRPDEVSMLVYTPAAPLTQTNALYLARQRKAFQRGHPAPDFDSTGSGLESEAPRSSRLGEEDIKEEGGEAALQAMGFATWESLESPVAEEKDKKLEKSADGDVRMEDSDTKSLHSATSTSHAEAEVIRLANIILFPDKSIF